MLTCHLFARVVDGRIEYRGTVESGGSTAFTGHWRSNRMKAMADADRAAKEIHQRLRRGQAVSQGKIGYIWRVEKELH